MPLEIVTVPCLSDNYAFLLHDAQTGATGVVDVPEAAPIRAALAARGWTLTDILITHHHWDHISGVDDLITANDIAIWGNRADAKRLPPLTHALNPGDRVTIGSESGTMMDVSGHTIGHVAFYFPASAAVFTADSLMALGCGRLFEGTAPQMFESLGRLAALPPETEIYSGHEYTEANAKFALTIEPDNPDLISRCDAIGAARSAGRPTVPSTLREELATNPFLRSHITALKTRLGMADASDSEIFAEIRARKDKF
jgi:hydroxyacylglutathione hydrolase